MLVWFDEAAMTMLGEMVVGCENVVWERDIGLTLRSEFAWRGCVLLASWD